MKRTYNIYCDESTHLENDGMPYLMIAYVSSPYNQLKQHKKAISQMKEKHKFKGEIKWSNVSNAQYPFYNELIDYFFATDLWFRAVIVEKSKIDNTRPGFSYDEFYFKMYYQLLHHKLSMADNYNIYIDIKDTRSHKKIAKLKEILSYNASIRTLQAIHSYESSLMQLADLIMGAINYKLRNLNKVIAKNNLIDKIEQNFNGVLINSTPKHENKLNLFFIDLK
ncbi:MAG TPA: DUF3800 domain-containing protein [Saprospiraceae bacterium]|nr:DUF3800 domain-containing protein [Saprospiraceae bacterium]HMP25516.1 DUF3800 domain-containing protein [Saprospiraceae bacterium]